VVFFLAGEDGGWGFGTYDLASDYSVEWRVFAETLQSPYFQETRRALEVCEHLPETYSSLTRQIRR